MKKITNLNRVVTVLILLLVWGSTIPLALAAFNVTTDKSQYNYGETVTVTISGGTASDIALIQVENPGGVKILADQVTLDGSGGGTFDFTVGSGWTNGFYDILVKDVGSDTTSTKKVTLGPPIVPPPYIPPNALPIARAGADQKTMVGRTVYFSGSGSTDADGTIISYTWTFGDGATATGVSASHKYSAAGTYTVTLKVKDDRQAISTDTAIVTVTALPIEPEGGVDESVGADEVDYIVDATATTNSTVTLNTTSPVTVTVLKYPSNPHPETPLPTNSLSTVVDVAVSDPSAVVWPIYVERSYTDAEIVGLNESALALYYYKDGEWLRCRNTGVYVDENIVWAYMYEDEVTGSPTVIAPILAAASFQVSDLSVSPSEVEPGDTVTISVLVTNVGEETGNYTVILSIDSVEEETETVTLAGSASSTITFTVARTIEATYSVEVNGLSSSFTVETPFIPEPPTPAEFEVSSLSITPSEVDGGDDVSVSMTVTNVGEESGSYTIEVMIDGVLVDSGTVTLDGGASQSVGFTVTSDVVGSHSVEVDGLSGSFSVRAPPEPPEPAEFEVSDLSVSPSSVEAGDSVTVTVTVSNVGELSGGYSVELYLDGALEDTKSVTLDGGDSTTVTFSVSTEEAGSHTVTIEELSGTFEVEAPKAGFPWTYVIIAIVLIAAVAYYLYSQRR